MAGVGPDGVTGSTGTAGSGEATSPDGCRPKTVAGVGCADVAGLTGAADGAETGMVTGGNGDAGVREDLAPGDTVSQVVDR